MSVNFYDKNNPARWNDDGDQISGGIEVNLANSNAYTVLSLMGLCSRDNPDLYGEIDGHNFRKCAYRALANLEIAFNPSLISMSDDDDFYYRAMKSRVERLLTVFADTETVCWG